MKIMVGYNGGAIGRRALSIAREYAKTFNAFVYIITSMEGGTSEKRSDIEKAQDNLDFAASFMQDAGVECDARQSVRGLSPGEDLVKFADDNDIAHIFLGVRTKSRAQKVLLGSISSYVILKASCPVTTVNWDLTRLSTEDILKDQKILIVDDEPDIIETIEELLDMCSLDTAPDFETAKKLLNENKYDIAILDIMGIQGYDLLDLARERDIPALMLTAHALTPENLKESIEKGADAYVPKDELANIANHIADVIKSNFKGKKGNGAWFSNLKPFFDKAFGKGWRDKDRNFWNNFDDKYGR
ncbi:MAG: universal stress protein [Desulfobacteraceae bacterium]|nr:universal stress protein [Desulfobacteraceae bacterium]